MNFILIIGLILFIAAAILIFKFVKKIVKAILMVISLAVIFTLIITYASIVPDINDFRENFLTTPSTYLLEDQDDFVAGMSVILGETNFDSISKTKLDTFEKDNLDNILDDNYKLFIVSSEAFESLGDINIDSLTKQEAMEILNSNNPMNEFIRLQLGGMMDESLAIQYRDQLRTESDVHNDDDFRAILFMILIQTAMEEQGNLMLFEQYKKGNVIVYPETALFKVIKIIPTSLLDKFISKQVNKQK